MSTSRVLVPLVISVLTLAALGLAFWIVALVDSGASARGVEPIVIGREEGSTDDRPGLELDGREAEDEEAPEDVDETSSTTTVEGAGGYSGSSNIETVEQPIHMRTMEGPVDHAPSASPPPAGPPPADPPSSTTPMMERNHTGDSAPQGESPPHAPSTSRPPATSSPSTHGDSTGTMHQDESGSPNMDSGGGSMERSGGGSSGMGSGH